MGWDGMLVHHRVITQLYTWVERGTVRVECLAQEHNVMSLARARNQTARFGDERTNHEATASPSLPDVDDELICSKPARNV